MAENIKEIITKRILAALEAGTCPWRKPWSSINVQPCNISGRRYSGINWFILQMCGFANPIFLTYKQAAAMGGNVKRGEKGIPVIFWKILKKTEDGVEKTIPMMRYYTVFNFSQCENITLPKKFTPKEKGPDFNPIAACEALWDAWEDKPGVEYGGGSACYRPALDKISMPNRVDFTSPAEFYSTLFHEGGHSTGAAKRLNRKEVTGAILFGSMDYSQEELVAEMTAAFLCAETGIDMATLDNSAAYIASWLRKLKSDPGMLITAAGKAQKAAECIMGKVMAEEEEEAA